MSAKPALTSAELGTLWLTYQEKTMILRMLEHFLDHSDDEEATSIMHSLYNDLTQAVQKITAILQKEGAVVPLAFTEKDVCRDTPKLYGPMFDIMFVRLLKKISMGLHTLHEGMSYREDMMKLYEELSIITRTTYQRCTHYLLKKGTLPRPPYVSMPRAVEFAKDTNYLGIVNPLVHKRVLNVVEVAYLYNAIESNIIGKQLMMGFAQAAENKEAREFFLEGKELAQSIIEKLSKILHKDDIPVPAPSAGRATDSTVAPFSDKLMMYCTSLLCSFGLGSNAIGTALSLRNDIPTMLSSIAVDTFSYAHKGAKIMVRNGWLEEPPSMEDREKLSGK